MKSHLLSVDKHQTMGFPNLSLAEGVDKESNVSIFKNLDEELLHSKKIGEKEL